MNDSKSVVVCNKTILHEQFDIKCGKNFLNAIPFTVQCKKRSFPEMVVAFLNARSLRRQKLQNGGTIYPNKSTARRPSPRSGSTFFPLPARYKRNESGDRSTAASWRPRSATKGTGWGRRAATTAAAATRKLQAYQVMTLPPTQT